MIAMVEVRSLCRDLNRSRRDTPFLVLRESLMNMAAHHAYRRDPAMEGRWLRVRLDLAICWCSGLSSACREWSS